MADNIKDTESTEIDDGNYSNYADIGKNQHNYIKENFITFIIGIVCILSIILSIITFVNNLSNANEVYTPVTIEGASTLPSGSISLPRGNYNVFLKYIYNYDSTDDASMKVQGGNFSGSFSCISSSSTLFINEIGAYGFSMENFEIDENDKCQFTPELAGTEAKWKIIIDKVY
jgi:hypothetical protein